jgi:hypothetical protein
MSLSGASSLLYEYYENAGGNEVKFNNLTLILANTLATNTTQNICIGNTGLGIGGDVYGILPAGITLSGTGYQWTYSTAPAGARISIAGATGATYAPTTAVSPFNSVGTFYIYRNAVLRSTNNVLPNPYLDTLESNAATIIIAPAPSASISYAGNPFCSTAGISTVTRTGTSGGIYSSAAGLTINASTGAITPVTSTAGTYTVTYTIAAAGGCGEYQVTTVVNILAAGTWTGAVDTNWNNGSNWLCNTVPASITNVTIPTGLTNYPVLNTVGGSVKNITIQSSASLTVTGYALRIAGIISNSGIFNAAAGTIEMNGTNTQTIPSGTFAGKTVSGFIINNTAGVTLADTLKITGDLTVTNGTLNTAGYLVLKSSDTSNARVAQITSVAATPINGNVTVERYIPGKRKYRLITSAVTTSTNTILTAGQEGLSIWGNWQNGGINTTPNLGTLITGGALTDGFDQGTTNASFYTYDDVNRKYIGYTTANGKNTKYTPLKAGIAYFMFVYGDRLNSVFATIPHNTVMDAAGILLTGDQTYTTSSAIPLTGVTGRYTLLGNPFASPIDWAVITKNNLADTYWGWDPNLASTGGYITVTTLGGVTISSPYSGVTGLNQYIQSGQGFFVKTIGPSPVLTIHEQDKVADFNDHAFRVNKNLPLLAINLEYVNNGSKVLADGVVAVFDPLFTNTNGTEDAAKMVNSAENISLMEDTAALSIDARQMPQNNDTIFLNVLRLTKPQYTFQIFAEHLDTGILHAYLQDRYLNTLQMLSLTDTNNITINVNRAIPASFDAGRFRIVFNKGIVLPLNFISNQASWQGSDVMVKWEIAEEDGVYKYEIERSADGFLFNTVGEVPAKGNSRYKIYDWLDLQPLTSISYYRIRALHSDGSYLFSPVAVVNYTTLFSKFTVYPNPVIGHQVIIRSTAAKKGQYSIQLFNQQGQLIVNRIVVHAGGPFNQTVHMKTNLPDGNYYLQITGDNWKQNLKFLLE